MKLGLCGSIAVASLLLFPASAFADCSALPDHAALQKALQASVKASGGPSNGGFDLNMWATLVDRDDIVCQVAFSGSERGDQWPGSRVISAQKIVYDIDGAGVSKSGWGHPTCGGTEPDVAVGMGAGNR